MATSSSTDAPQQAHQPSRKGKRAWRKNIDISEVQEGLEKVRDEEVAGGLVAEKPSDSLFTVDVSGSASIQAAYNKIHKPLRADEILAQRSRIPAVNTRQRSVRVTDGIIEPKSKRHKADGVKPSELERLRRIAHGKEDNQLKSAQKDEGANYDPWAETYTEPPVNGNGNKPSAKAPRTLKQRPISMLVEAGDPSAVPQPRAGLSYNPLFEDWDALITAEGEKELDLQRRRLLQEEKEKEWALQVEQAGREPERQVVWFPEDDSAWEGLESDYERSESIDLKKKRPTRMTPQERKKAERKKERQRLEKAEQKEKKRARQEKKMVELISEARREEKKRVSQGSSEAKSKKVDDETLKRRGYGKQALPAANLELVLPDELQESLRSLRPEGNLLRDRYRNFLVRGKLEARKAVSQPKKKQQKATEKWSYKDWKVPV